MIERFRESDDVLRLTPEEVVSLMQHWAQLEIVQQYRAGRIRDALVHAASNSLDDAGYIALGREQIDAIDSSIVPLLDELQNDLDALNGWHISWITEGDEDDPQAVRRSGWFTGGEVGLVSWRIGEIITFVTINDGDPEIDSGVGTFLWNMRDIILTPPTE